MSRNMSDIHRDIRAQVARFVEQAYEDLETKNYYQMLGVAKDAPEHEIRDAYYRVTGRLHPDLYGEGIPPDMMRQLTAVYSRLVEAYKVLTSGERRQQYDAGLAEGRRRLSGDAAAKSKIRRAEEQVGDGAARKFFVLGRNALLSGNATAAVMNLRLALSMEPNNQVIKDELAKAEKLGGSST
jgi:DnaJ-class molecular chaperone